MKTLVKSLLRTLAPDRYTTWMAERTNRHGRRVLDEQGVPEIARALVERYGAQVQGGPLAGMQYLTQSIGSSFIPKLLGSYERELHETLTRVLATPYDSVVDVGSAEGFYTVGLALRLPGRPRVYAYDVDPEAQKLCAELAWKNQVGDRVVIRGGCDPRELQRVLQGRSLVLSDCEGGELELFDPAKTPALRAADLLIELHDMLRPGITPTLIARFAPTHQVQLIDTRERDPANYPSLSFLPPEQQRTAVSEFRNGPQQWAFLTPHRAVG